MRLRSERLTAAGSDRQVNDIIGVGFGPSNLAVAAAIHDECRKQGRKLQVRFLECKRQFAWHEQMMVNGATMQISFLKDLATQRDPMSYFTFLNYLKSVGRLSKFTNLRNFYPSRLEFQDYLRWAARHFDSWVDYGTEVIAIEPKCNLDDDKISLLRVSTMSSEGGQAREFWTRNIVFSTGPVPHLPCHVPEILKDKVFHTNNFLEKINNKPVDDVENIIIVGGGQSAVECALHINAAFEKAKVTLCIRGHTLYPADDSYFVNEIFFPENISSWYKLDLDTRNRLLSEYSRTNYSVVDSDLLSELYNRLYQSTIEPESNNSRMTMKTGIHLHSLVMNNGKVECNFEHVYRQREKLVLLADRLVFATGYQHVLAESLIKRIRSYCATDAQPVSVDQHYRMNMAAGFLPQIFVLGINENTHGIGDTLLSNMAIKANVVVNKLLGEQRNEDSVSA